MRRPNGASDALTLPGFTAESSIYRSRRRYWMTAPSGLPESGLLRTAQSLVDYDQRWPQLFEAERRRISAALGNKAVAIEHVGSSSVPGLRGRSEIDVLVGVASASDIEDSTNSLKRLGYCTASQAPSEGWSLMSKATSIPFEVLIVEHLSPLWRRHLGFRDYLRRTPANAAAYSRQKEEWATRYGAGTAGYKEAKRRFWISVGETALH